MCTLLWNRADLVPNAFNLLVAILQDEQLLEFRLHARRLLGCSGGVNCCSSTAQLIHLDGRTLPIFRAAFGGVFSSEYCDTELPDLFVELAKRLLRKLVWR